MFLCLTVSGGLFSSVHQVGWLGLLFFTVMASCSKLSLGLSSTIPPGHQIQVPCGCSLTEVHGPSCDWAVTAAGVLVSGAGPWGWLRTPGCVCCWAGLALSQLVAVTGLVHCGHSGEKGRSPRSACLTVATEGLLLGGASSWHSWLAGPSNNCCVHTGEGARFPGQELLWCMGPTQAQAAGWPLPILMAECRSLWVNGGPDHGCPLCVLVRCSCFGGGLPGAGVFSGECPGWGGERC